MYKTKRYCRICLVVNKELCDILQKGENNISHLTKLTKIVPQMKKVKHPSRFICKECCEELNASYNFYEKCIKSHIIQQLPENSTEISEMDTETMNNNTDLNLEQNCEVVRVKIEDETNDVFDTVTECDDLRRRMSDFSSITPATVYDDSSSNKSQEILKCVMCNAEFTNKDVLQEHIRITHAVRKLLEYDSYGTIRRAAEKQTHKFISEVNNRKSKRTSLLENSQILMTNIINEANVEKTKKNVPATKENNTKLSIDMKKSKKKYECVFCAKTLDNKVQLTKHLQLHEISDMQEVKSFKCKQCDVSFNELTRLTLHVRSVHEKQDSHQCPKCSVACATAKYLRAHMHVHDSTKPGPGYVPHKKGGYKCLTCGMRLSNRASAGGHMKTHSSVKPYICATCPASFKTKDCLKQHETTQHDPPRHPCSVCDRVFNYKYTLMQHLATHINRGEKKC